MRKKYVLLLLLVLFISSLFFLNAHLVSTLSEVQERLDSSQEVLLLIRAQDSIVYQILLTEDISQVSLLQDQSIQQQEIFQIFSRLISSDSQIGLSIETSFQKYLELELIKQEIIQLHRLHLISSIENYEAELRRLLLEYEDLSARITTDFQTSLDMLRIDLEKLTREILFIFIILNIFYLVLLSLLIFKNKVTFKKNAGEINQTIEDPIFVEILNYVKEKTESEKYVTIKDLKSKFNLTHPTILSKINYLEAQDKIKILKKGRNKYLIFIKF